ncbi:MFS transporter [Streptomyces sp. BH106]|uniref:MFS transporter n=1 Tax=Streptomyces sp. BH106 TaxID=3410409 RepID=UPI003CEEE021
MAIASLVGTTIEIYDFNVYATSVIVVLGSLFFPAHDPLVSSLLAVSTVGVGFFARPLGGIVFSHFGDRLGRKNTLLVSLVLMGATTVLVGALPTYEQIGIAAPILLIALRFVQGLAIGGEWGGAVLVAVEHAPREKRGLYGAFPMFGTPLGILGAAAVIALFRLLPDESFRSWGWRMPFLASIVLLAIGIYIRLRMEESSQFIRAKDAHTIVRTPLIQVMRQSWRSVLIGAGVCFITHAGIIVSSLLPSLVVSARGLPDTAATVALITASLGMFITLFFTARQLKGREQLSFTFFGATALAVWAFPAFLFAYNWGTFGLVLAITVNGSLTGIHAAALPAVISRLFPANVRYTGISVTYQLSAILGGGLLPILSSYLVGASNGAFWPAAALMCGSAALTALCSLLCRRLPQPPAESPVFEEQQVAKSKASPAAPQ